MRAHAVPIAFLVAVTALLASALPGSAEVRSDGVRLKASSGGLYDVSGYSQITIELDRLPSTPNFQSVLGYYLASSVGRPIDGNVIWSNISAGVPTEITVDLRRLQYATKLGFFLIPDGAIKNDGLQDLAPVRFLRINGKWSASAGGKTLAGLGDPAYFSDPRLNVGNLQRARISSVEGTMNWEENASAFSPSASTPSYQDVRTSLAVIGRKRAGSNRLAGSSASALSRPSVERSSPEGKTPLPRSYSLENERVRSADDTPDDLSFYDIKDAQGLILELTPLPSKGAYRSSFGYYLTDQTGRPYRGKVVWSDINDASARTLSISRKSLGIAEGIGFFIIPDGARLNPELTDDTLVGLAEYAGEWTVVRNGYSLNGASLPAFLSDPRWNADGVDHAIDGPAPGNLNWEDEYRGGDLSFDDVNLDISLILDGGAGASLVTLPKPRPSDDDAPAEATPPAAPEAGIPAVPDDVETEVPSVSEATEVTPPESADETPAEGQGADPFWGQTVISGFGEVELSYFPEDPLFDRQSGKHVQQSVAGSIELVRDAGARGETLLELFGRYDQIDDQRSYVDIQRAHYAYFGDVVSLTAGVLNESWGVLELENIVDIVNQRNIAEDFRADAKLGQPGIKLGLPVFAFGQADIYYLPYPRRRPFAGEDGRFQLILPVDDDDAFYDSAADGVGERWAEQMAGRLQFLLGDLEAAVSHFYGTSRDPVFDVVLDGATPVALSPSYDQINQTGLELRALGLGNVLKLETFRRTGDNPFGEGEAFYGIAGGIEREFVRILDSDLNLTMFGEYYYDSRSRTEDAVAPAALDNDVFVGGRLTFNDLADTTLLLTGTIDVDTRATILTTELQRRIGENLQVTLRGDAFVGVDDDASLETFRKDHRVQARVRYYY